MNNSEVLGESLNKANNIRFRVNCEFLYSCAFHCAGCFVNRRSSQYDDHQLDVLLNTIELFRNNGLTFDEIILGPTDFFAAKNTAELLQEEKFKEIFKNGDVVLTILTTLQTEEDEIRELIKVVNENLTHPDQEIETLVVFNLERVMEENMDYVTELRTKLALLDQFNAKVDYALQMNIQDTSKIKGYFTLDNITKFVREQFNTIVEFNPSFARTANSKIVTNTLDAWNSMLSSQIDENNKDDHYFSYQYNGE